MACHSTSPGEVGRLLGGYTPVPVLAVVAIIVGLYLLASSSSVGSRERFGVLDLLNHVCVLMDHVKLWLSNIIIEVNRLVLL